MLSHELVLHRLGDQFDEGILGGNVVMERRDIDADTIGNLSRSQALETLLDDQRARSGCDRSLAFVGCKVPLWRRGHAAKPFNQSLD
jgi:hypothetical protein